MVLVIRYDRANARHRRRKRVDYPLCRRCSDNSAAIAREINAATNKRCFGR